MTPSKAKSWPRALAGLLAATVAAVALTGCSLHPFRRVFKENNCNKPQPYDLASSIPPLKVPVGIDPPDTQGALSVPAYDQPAPPPRKLTAPCLDAPPLFAMPTRSTTPAQPAAPARNRVPST
jgi:hypothetical protein